MLRTLHGVVFVCLFAGTSGIVSAQIDPIPKESGFHGFVNLGAMYLNVESNMVAGNDLYNVDDSVITSLTASPESKSTAAPLINLDLRYTFASTRTQLFFGTSLEDFLRLDLTTLAGVRQGVSERSSVSASLVFSSFPADVWADPYVVNRPRQSTERKNTGLRLNWDKIADSDFTVQYTYRDIKLDDELSGVTQLGLPPAQAALLVRNGDQHTAEIHYAWRFAPRHALAPAYRYNKFNLDGDAMANDRHTLQLTYLYHGDIVSVVVNAEYAKADYDAVNPIYLTTRDDDKYGAGIQLFWHGPFGAPKDLSLLANLAGYNSDSNINFYDEKYFVAGLSAFYRF